MGSKTTQVRYRQGETVWVAPSSSGQWVCDDEAVILEDLDTGYLVLQESERVPSHGQGHFVCDVEVTMLFGPSPIILPRGEVRQARRLGSSRCSWGRQKRVLVHN